MNDLLVYIVLYPVAAVALLASLASMGRWRPPAWCLWAIVAAGVVASVVRLYYLDRSGAWGIDLRIFRDVGVDILSGIDPYRPDRFASHRFLNPPSTFPLFALFAALPFRASLVFWSLINSALAFLVVPQAARVLNLHDGGEGRAGSPAELAAIATAFALSDACMAAIQLGQVPLLATFFILLALEARGRDRPIAAGAALGIATMKVGTVVPFLLLFLRRRDIRTWIALALSVLALIAVGGQAMHAPDQAWAMLHEIGELSRPGAVNDISYAGPYNEWILGFDHLAYRLGVRGSTALKLVQFAALGLLGVWLAARLHARKLPEALGISLVSLYSVVFLYHRLYDVVMIAPALVYAHGRAKATRGRARLLFATAAVLMWSVLYLRRRTLGRLTDWVEVSQGVAARLVEWIVLPGATWAILLAMPALVLAHRASTRSEPGGDRAQ